MGVALGSFRTILVGMLAAGIGWAQITERVSVNASGQEGNNGAGLTFYPYPSVSTDGRYVVFYSDSSNLVPSGTTLWHVYLHDRTTGTNELVSVTTGGAPGNWSSGSFGFTITPDARFVAFESEANNLVPGDTNGYADVFVRDRLNGTTEMVSVDSNGIQGNYESELPSLSSDGRYVAFASRASYLVPGDLNSTWDVFVRDRVLGVTELVSISTAGLQGDVASYYPSISADGRFVAFQSDATNLVPGASNGSTNVFVRDRYLRTTELVSLSTGGVPGDQYSTSPSISRDGRFVAFTSYATDLVPGDTNGYSDIFVRDRSTGTTERVSIASGGTEGAGGSDFASISGDGRYVAFMSSANNLVPGGTSGQNVFVHDRASGTTELVSVTSQGGQTRPAHDLTGSISRDGRYVVFLSEDRDLVPGDTNGRPDVFIHDRVASGFTSLCDPGVAGVRPCPCANPPAGAERGCDNSSATGGASLSASGIAYLSIDSLTFRTAGERPTALSILMQGSAGSDSGWWFGQGVRCAGGAMRQLFVKTAVAGGITAPDLAAGDPTVSARSAAQGDVIHSGQSRWYFVYYRDPTVLGGCSASRTFNVTQTGQVSWRP